MCGRYFIDEEMAEEIGRIVKMLDGGWKVSGRRDVYPSESAPVLCGRTLRNGAGGKHGDDLNVSVMKWGFPAYHGNTLIINARAESAMEKRLFADCMEADRCVIPAAGFYEWNRRKEKCEFYRKDRPVLFMAGCFCYVEEEAHFTILTTKANTSVSAVHDRMPLILEENEVSDWLCDRGKVEGLLKKEPPLLKRRQDYEQISLF